MMTSIIMMSTMMSGMIFIQMNHPMAMGLMLLIQTMLTCLMTGMVSKTFWFSYILFLIFLGGMLVLFIYVTALASNEMFSMSMNMLMKYSMIMTLMLSLMMINDMYLIFPITENIETTIMSKTKNLHQENFINLIKLYNYPTNLTTILLMNYLLITLIAVVKITNVFYGPLRKMN